MTNKKYSISAVIIARNEEATVGKVIEESLDVLPKLTNNYEILVNDDASLDKTPQILDSYSKKFSFIKVFHQRSPLGISGGLEFLYKKAKKQLIFTNAADGQFTARDLPRMVEKISQGYDLVIGKRERKIQYSYFRNIISLCFNLLPKILFGFNLYDPGGIKLYKKKVIKKTIPISKSVFNEAERIIRAYKLGYKVIFVPIRYFPRKSGKATGATLRNIFRAMIDMLKLRFLIKL